MRKNIYLSGVALSVILLVAPPASAQINLGGDGDSGVSVDLGGGGGVLGGGDGGALNLGGNGGSDTSASANVDLGSATILDSDGDGIGDMLDIDGDGDNDLIDIDGDGVADLVDLDGDGVGDQEVNAELLGVGENGETQAVVGTGNDDEVIVNLFGASGTGETATANILPGGTDDPVTAEQDEATVGVGNNDAVVDLFGSGSSDDSARVAINPSTEAAGAGDVTGESEVTLDLFGPGGDGGTGGSGTGVDPTETGSTGGGGSDGGDGASGSIDPMAPGGAGSSGGGERVAAVGDASLSTDASCFTPDDGQIAHLIARNSYSGETTASWSAATNVSLVPIVLCPEARDRLAAALDANANIDVMQSAVASSAKIVAALDPQYQPDDVLAVDKSGDQLTVYVY